MSVKQSAERSRRGVIITKPCKIKLIHKCQSGIAQGLCAKDFLSAISDHSQYNEEKMLSFFIFFFPQRGRVFW